MENSQNNYSELLEKLPRAFNSNPAKAIIKSKPEDFKVFEKLTFEPSGNGEHLFLQIRKVDTNTEWVARQLQKTFMLSSREIGYAGKKDRHSISTQWFSLHLPGKEVDLSLLDNSAFKIIRSIRHHKKLRIGSVLENEFEITLRELTSIIARSIIDQVVSLGAPNYFGNQRFGFEGNNLVKANELLNQRIKIKNRNKRGLIISSARSLIFNLLLANRIERNSWINPLKGDCMMLDGTQSFFVLDELSDLDEKRIAKGDLHICGLMAGKKKSQALDDALLLENTVLENFVEWLKGLERLDLETNRRAYRCIPRNFSLEQNDGVAILKFTLSKGSYATAVVRELVDATDVSIRTAVATSVTTEFEDYKISQEPNCANTD